MITELLSSDPPILLIAKATALLVTAWLVAFILRRQAAALRHLVWLCCAAGLLALPLFSLVFPAWNVVIVEQTSAIPEGPAVTDSSSLGALAEHGSDRRSAESFMDRGSGADASVPTGIDALAPYLPTESSSAAESSASAAIADARGASGERGRAPWIALWAAGTVVLLLIRVAGEWRVRQIRLACLRAEEIPSAAGFARIFRECAAELAMSHPPRVLVHPSLSLPFTCGVWRPVIVLPEESLEWKEEKIRPILLHELGHVKRRDCLTQWIGQCAMALFWFHPLAWWMIRQLQVEREKACDDVVLATGEAPSRYSRVLLHLATGTDAAGGTPPRGALAITRKSTLEGRLLALLNSRRRRTGAGRTAVAAAFGIAAFVTVPLAMLRAVEAEPGGNGPPAAQADVALPSGFVLVDDFQEYGPRNVLEFFAADSWVPHGMSGTHQVQGEGGNYFLGTGYHLRRGISRKLPPELTLGDGERGTWFFRLRVESESVSRASLGLASDPRLVMNAGDWERAGVMAVLEKAGETGGYDLKAWDSRSNRMERIATLGTGVWHNLWFVIDRGEANAFAVYLTEGRESASRSSRLFFGDSLESEVNRFSFREGLTAGSILNYVMFMALDSKGNSLHIDDIWIDPHGANLSLPVTESKSSMKVGSEEQGSVLTEPPDTRAFVVVKGHFQLMPRLEGVPYLERKAYLVHEEGMTLSDVVQQMGGLNRLGSRLIIIREDETTLRISPPRDPDSPHWDFKIEPNDVIFAQEVR